MTDALLWLVLGIVAGVAAVLAFTSYRRRARRAADRSRAALNRLLADADEIVRNRDRPAP